MRPQHSFATILLAGCLLACGKSSESRPMAGSGSSTASAPVADAAGPVPWHIVKVGGEVVIVASEDCVAVLGADGRVLARPKVADVSALENAAITPGAVIWIDGENAQIHLLDLVTGKERWHKALETQSNDLAVGAHDVAVLHASGVDLYQLTDGSRSYQQSSPMNAAGRFFDKEGFSVFVDELGGIRAVDEGSHKRLWSFDLHRSQKIDNPGLAVQNGRVVVWYDDKFVELDSKSGKLKERGAVSFVAPGRLPGTLARVPDGGTIAMSGEGQLRTVFRFNDIGRILWRSTEWSDDVFLVSKATVWQSHVAAMILMESTTGVRRLIGFNDKTGHLTFRRDLGAHSVAVGMIDDCALILDLDHARKLECLDANTGAGRWARPVIGANAMAVQIGDHVLLGDGSPAAVAYLDATGKALWQVALPETEIRDTAQGTGLIAHGSRDVLHQGRWHIGKDVLVLPDEQSVHVLGLASGKLVEVKL